MPLPAWGGIVAAVTAILIIGLYYWTTRAPCGVPSSGSTFTATSRYLPSGTVTFTRMRNAVGPLPNTTTSIRSNEGTSYRFTFVQFHDGTCRAYIRRCPSYGARDRDLQGSHRLPDGRRGQYVCFRPEPRVPEQLVTIVAHWVNATDNYRRTGIFPSPSWA